MGSSIKRQLFTVAGISLLDKLIKFVFLAIFSRLLLPEDYGVVAAALLVVGFAELFSNVGLGMCLIQAREVSSRDIRTAVTLSCAVAAVLALSLTLFSSAVSSAVDIPELKEVIPWLSLILVFRGLSTISSALLQRAMKAGLMLWLGVGAYLAGSILVALPLALGGYGYRSIIYGVVCENFIYMIALFVTIRHPVAPLYNKESARKLLTKGVGFFASRTINYFALNADYLIVSRTLGASALGYYSRAYKVMEYPSVIYRNAVDKVVFPLMSQRQDDPAFLNKALADGFFMTLAISSIISGFLAANGVDVVLLLLGDQWRAAGQILAVLAAFGMFRLGFMIFGTYVRAKGYVLVSTLHSLVFFLMVTGFCYLGADYGMVGVGIGAGIAVTLHCMFYTGTVKYLTGMPLSTFARIYFSGIFIFFAIFLPNFFLGEQIESMNRFLKLVVLGTVTGSLCLILLTRPFNLIWGDMGATQRQAMLAFMGKKLQRFVRRFQ